MNASTSFLCRFVLPGAQFKVLFPPREEWYCDMTEQIHPESHPKGSFTAGSASSDESHGHVCLEVLWWVGPIPSVVFFSKNLHKPTHHKEETSDISKWSSILHNTRLVFKSIKGIRKLRKSERLSVKNNVRCENNVMFWMMSWNRRLLDKH